MKAILENLHKHVAFLTSIYPYRNYKNLESLREAADYIEKEMRKFGLGTTRQKWKANGNSYENIIASYQPQKSKRFILRAHYDVYKESPGADDNASSVAGMLEVMRILTENDLKLDYGIDFVSYCLEEPPFFKTKEMESYVHAKSIADNGKDYIGMIALEMIGYYREEKTGDREVSFYRNRLIVSGIRRYDAFNLETSQLLQEAGEMDSRRLSFADDYRNNGPSDHRNYWSLGIPAVMVIGSGGQGNPHYHTPTDTIDTLDFKVMTHAVNSIAYALFNYSD